MKLTSLLGRAKTNHESVSWHQSEAVSGVRFAIRRISLAQRIELNRKLRELTLQYEFLKIGDAASQLEASLSELLVAKLYVEWGLAEIEGLAVDGWKARADDLIARGPEKLTDEIVLRVQAEISLPDEERKN